MVKRKDPMTGSEIIKKKKNNKKKTRMREWTKAEKREARSTEAECGQEKAAP